MSEQAAVHARDEDDVIRYGNLREPKMPGLGRLSFAASVFLGLAAVLLMLLSLISIWAGLVWGVAALAVAVPTAFPTRDGYGRYQALWRSRLARRAAKAGRNTLRQGVAGAVPDGACRLPGVAASTELSSHVDMHGRPFGLVHWPHADLYAVVLHTSPGGFSGTDKTHRDAQVAQWAGWVAQLNTVEEVVGAAVVVETVPDSGQRLERAMERGRVDDAAIPEFARTMEGHP